MNSCQFVITTNNREVLQKKYENIPIPYFVEKVKYFTFLLTSEDIDSIGSSSPTKTATEFVKFTSQYNTNTESSEHCFWSGMEAKKKAQSLTNLLKDSDYAVINLLFEICVMVRENNDDTYFEELTRVSFATSRVFALFSKGNAHIFVSTDKDSEPPGFTCNNNFWDAELPILQMLYFTKVVTNIWLYFYDHTIKSWLDPVSIHQTDIDFPIWRRKWHPILDKVDIKDSFVHQKMTPSQWDSWRKNKPRTYITFQKLKQVIRHWKNIVFRNYSVQIKN